MTTCLQGVSKCFLDLLHELLLRFDSRLVASIPVFLSNHFLQVDVVSWNHTFVLLATPVFSVLIDGYPVRLLGCSDCYHSAVASGPHLQVTKVHR